MKATSEGWISAAEAVRLLRVTRPTLYAYVSRGFIRSEATAGPTRARRYARDDVDRLRRRAEERREPDKVAAHAMHWGLPVLESSITMIADGTLYYRGHDAVVLAGTKSVKEVASLIWTGACDRPLMASATRAARKRGADVDLPFIARAQAALAAASVRDPAAFDTRPEGVVQTGWAIMTLLTRTLATAPSVGKTNESLEETIARAWRVKGPGVDLLRAALILCADHELNVSAFTARCVASSGSNPYAVVVAGLSALEGVRHGGMTIRVEAMLGDRDLRRARRLRAALADRLRRGDRIDGFGHPLYPNGDPRATALLALLRDGYRRSPEWEFVHRLASAGTALTREHPNLDFALGALSRILKLPQGSGLTLFAIGRTIGWIGHALEQYATGQIIRPRAKYVGVVPDGTAR
jgi:citrate synthase